MEGISLMTDHTTEIAVRKQEIAPALLTTDQLKFISSTEFVPKSMRGNLPAILACVATGRALGLPDMSALRSINIIDGKAAFSSELMVQLVRSRGHSITGDVSGDEACVRGKRLDNGDEMTCTWTLEMAQRAGLLNKQNWKQYPEAMLWARAVSQLCRMLFADCFAGATYTDEEAELTVDEMMDETPVEPEPVEAQGELVEGEVVEDLSGEIEAQTLLLLALSDSLGNRNTTEAAVRKHAAEADQAAHLDWLRKQVARAEAKAGRAA